MQDAYIIAGSRSAVGRAGKGGFRNHRSDDLAVEIIQHMMRGIPALDPKEVDDVIVGCANPEGEQGLQIGRQISLRALGKDVPGVTINRYCASGLEAIAMATAKIRSGMADCIIAGGTESMSMIPMTGYKLAPSYQVAKDTPDYLVSMGLTAEAVAKKYGISREESDAFAVRSHSRAAAAQAAGLFSDEIVPVTVTEVFVENDKRKERSWTVANDECVRPETSMEGLAGLRSVFANGGIVTAGTSSPTSDGAAFVVVMSDKMAARLGLSPKARLAACAVAGVDPLIMGIGPVAAIPKALQQAGLSLGQLDLVELNEAFAVQALSVVKEAGLDMDTLNVNGGAIALGHPLGCSGAKLSIQLMNELARRNKKYGMVTACVGGGQGIAGVFEMA